MSSETAAEYVERLAGKVRNGTGLDHLEVGALIQLAKGNPNVCPDYALPTREPESGEGWDLIAHLKRQQAWSLATFGPGPRTANIIDHIRKELEEVKAAPDDMEEWIDIVMMALDGAWRCGGTAEEIAATIARKFAKNEARDWPDWRTSGPHKAVEHIRLSPSPQSEPEPTPERCRSCGHSTGSELRLCERCDSFMSEIQRLRDLLCEAGRDPEGEPEPVAELSVYKDWSETRRAVHLYARATAVPLGIHSLYLHPPASTAGVTEEMAPPLNWMTASEAVSAAFDSYTEEHPDWGAMLDATPIPNDLGCHIIVKVLAALATRSQTPAAVTEEAWKRVVEDVVERDASITLLRDDAGALRRRAYPCACGLSEKGAANQPCACSANLLLSVADDLEDYASILETLATRSQKEPAGETLDVLAEADRALRQVGHEEVRDMARKTDADIMATAPADETPSLEERDFPAELRAARDSGEVFSLEKLTDLMIGTGEVWAKWLEMWDRAFAKQKDIDARLSALEANADLPSQDQDTGRGDGA